MEIDQGESITSEDSVFNRQLSTSDGSTTVANNTEQLIGVWLHTKSTAKHKSYETIKLKIENDLDLLKNYIDDPNKCEEAIVNSSEYVKIFLIISNKYSDSILDNIHNLERLHSIYIHEEIPNKKVVKTYSKVVNVFTDLDKLTDELSSKVYNYSRYAQLPITIFKERYVQDRTTNLLNKFAYFMDFWNPLFVDLLFDLSKTDYEQQKAKFIEQCRIYYRANETVLKVVDEFASTYTSEYSIQWYKRSAFVYRLLNKVMRQQNIQGILIFRFFIYDLFKQLNQIYHEFIDTNIYEDKTPDDVYRGQLMFVNELDNLKKNFIVGTVISINSFFSASRDQNVALDFCGALPTDKNSTIPTQELRPVLFQIRINHDHKNQLKRKPFADVSQLSDRDKLYELEIIFMVGSFFQVDGIPEEKVIETLNEEKKKIKMTVTYIKLTLINEDDVDLSIMKDFQVLKSTKTIQGKAIRIGNLLIDHSLSVQASRSKADSYYQALHNDPDLMMRGASLTGQAWVALKREQYNLAIELALEALSIDDKSNDELTITTLNCLAGAYDKLKDYAKALKYYEEAYDISKPTDEKIANKTYKGPCIPIDKYAMYDNYRNIASINLACIYQKQGETQLAWDMYKEAVDCEMRGTKLFHCHTCMFIAESGTHETVTSLEQHNIIWNNWKSFLDHGLGGILKYRTSVLTGYLSLTHKYDYPSCRYNNIYCRKMAIDYFKKVKNQCEPYAFKTDYYFYTLQCYERLADLYQYWDDRSINYYGKMIKFCLKYNPDDVDNLIIGYKGLRDKYKCRQSERADNPENMSLLLHDENYDAAVVAISALLTPPVTPETPPSTSSLTISGSLFQNIKPLHFAFGFYDKFIDPRLKTEPDLRKKLIYCHMKLAALYNEKKEIDESKNVLTDDAKTKLTGNVKSSLTEAIFLCRQLGSEMFNAIRYSNENLSFINENFDFIVESYKNRLPPVINFVGHCIDEENFCYIAYLYAKKNDSNSVDQFIKEPIKYFEQYDYVCSHTIDCYIKLAEHYQKIKKNKQAAIDTYHRMIHLMKRHRPDPMVTMMSIIEDHLIEYFKKIDNLETAISIYQKLCECIRDEITDITILYNHWERFLQLLVEKHKASVGIVATYDGFLNLILKLLNPLSSQMTIVLTHFRDHAIKTFNKFNEFLSAIVIYKSLINLLFEHQTNTTEIIREYKRVAAEFKTKQLFEDSIIAYENLLNFVYQHHSTGGFMEGDLIHFIFYVWKNEFIKQYSTEKKFNEIIHLYFKMIFIIKNYRENINHKYERNQFLSRIIESYDAITNIYRYEINNFNEMIDIYQRKIEFLITYDVESVQREIDTIFSICQQFAKDHQEQAIEVYLQLITFIEKNRLNYLSHLSIAYKEFDQLNSNIDNQNEHLHSVEQNLIVHYSPNLSRMKYLNQCLSDYKQKFQRYYGNKQFNKGIDVYKKEILPFLLKNHQRDDQQIATSYKQIASLYYDQKEKYALQVLDYYQKAIDIYEKQQETFYTEYAFQLNPNVCRTYTDTLFTCYNFKAKIYFELNDRTSSKTCKQKALQIYEKYKDQFEFLADPTTNLITIQIRSFVELEC